MLRVGAEGSPTQLFGLHLQRLCAGLLLPVAGDLAPWLLQFTGKRGRCLRRCFGAPPRRVGRRMAREALAGRATPVAAIRDDEEAVAALGVNPARATLMAMMLSSFFASHGGTFYAQLVGLHHAHAGR